LGQARPDAAKRRVIAKPTIKVRDAGAPQLGGAGQACQSGVVASAGSSVCWRASRERAAIPVALIAGPV
jgi:hypothetical protein